jgi:phosphoribosylglycinamide formyltransferase-1
MTLALGVLCSGEGTNLQAILDACASGELDARVHVVLSNRNAPCLARAERAGVSAKLVDHKAFADRDAFDRALVAALRDAGVSFVVLAGFMRLLGPTLLDAFPDAVLNVHPSLLPAFPGVNAVGQALAHGVKVTGCTVHLVDAGTDTGAIVAQSSIAIAEDDTEATLLAKLHEIEHRTLVRALSWFARGEVSVVKSEKGARVRLARGGEHA